MTAEEAIQTIAHHAQSAPVQAAKKKSWWAPLLVVGGGIAVVFFVIPAIRGTNVKQAWQDSANEDEELEAV